MKVIYTVIIIISLQIYGFPQEQNSATVDSISKSKTDSSVVNKSFGSDVKEELLKDSSNNVKSPSVKLNKKYYNHKNQVIFATGMMAFIAIILASVQNWNPD